MNKFNFNILNIVFISLGLSSFIDFYDHMQSGNRIWILDLITTILLVIALGANIFLKTNKK